MRQTTANTSLVPLFDTIRSQLLLVAQVAPPLLPDAVASHIRIRSKTPDQFAFYRYCTEDLGFFDTVKTVRHKEKEVIFARVRNGALFLGNLNQPIRWLEFTALRPDHEDGPDALVFKLPNATEATETRVTSTPPFFLRYQALSADDIVNR